MNTKLTVLLQQVLEKPFQHGWLILLILLVALVLAGVVVMIYVGIREAIDRTRGRRHATARKRHRRK